MSSKKNYDSSTDVLVSALAPPWPHPLNNCLCMDDSLRTAHMCTCTYTSVFFLRFCMLNPNTDTQMQTF